MKVRTLFVFYEGKLYIYTETKYEFACEGEIFNLTAKTPKQFGWKRYSVSDTEERPKVNYSKNDTFTAENISVKQCKTQQPKRFTESSLLAIMENIDRLIPDKALSEFVKERGLGTPATRAAIIEELIAVGYIERKKSSLFPPNMEESLLLLCPKMLSPLNLLLFGNRHYPKLRTVSAALTICFPKL